MLIMKMISIFPDWNRKSENFMTPNTRSLYQSPIADFIQRDASTILGHLVNTYHSSIQNTQTSRCWIVLWRRQ